MANDTKTQTLTATDLPRLRYDLPRSWYKAAGLLRHKHKALGRHLQSVRREWDRRTARA